MTPERQLMTREGFERHALTDETILKSLMCLVHKLWHAPTVHLKRSSREGRARDYVQLMRHLFELDS